MDISWDLSGRMVYKDWSFVLAGGVVMTVTVDASEPSTWFAAFREGSTRCSDRSRGVEVDGIGRMDDGALLAFTIVACDNSPGAIGPDAFHFLAPTYAGYARGGTLSSGDVAKVAGTLPTPAATRASGMGAIGPGAPTLWSDRQEFDFDVSAAATGRLFYRDYAVVRNNGAGQMAGHMIVDHSADAATEFSAYHQRTAECVRISGRGRIDTGDLLLFYIDVCDIGSAGTGFDTFGLTIPDRRGPRNPYVESGSLSSGDIALGSGTTPAPGNLEVITTSTGSNLDSDGYTVTLDGGSGRLIPVNGKITYENIAAGSHTVALSGVAANCTVEGGTTRTVTLPSGGSASAAFALNCASQASALVFTVQPSDAHANAAIQPPIHVMVVDAQGNRVTTFSGPVTMAIGRNGGLLMPGNLTGTTTVTAVAGVAAYGDLRIDQIGDGYTLRATAPGLTSAESHAFNVRL